jgi:hypothetical protein
MPSNSRQWRGITLLLLCALIPHLVRATPVLGEATTTVTPTQAIPSGTISSSAPSPMSTGTGSANYDTKFHWYYLVIIPLFVVGYLIMYALQWLGLCGNPKPPKGTYDEWQHVWTSRAYGRLLSWRRKPPAFGLQRMFPGTTDWTITIVPWDGNPEQIPPGCWVARPRGTKQEIRVFWQAYRPIPYESDYNAGGGG